MIHAGQVQKSPLDDGLGKYAFPPGAMTPILASGRQTWPAEQPVGTPRPPRGSLTPISPREREVLILVARGLTREVIAGQLGLALGTIKAVTAHLREKYETDSMATAVKHALNRGDILAAEVYPEE